MKENYIRKLISILENSDLETLELSTFWGMSKISLSKKIKSITTLASNQTNEVVEKPKNIVPNDINSSENHVHQSPDANASETTSEAQNLYAITAPLVGTFYQSSKPGDPPFIKEGDSIKTGQRLCIIEAMKIFNEIESEVDGVVKKISVNDASPVEYGQILFHVELND